jgi:protein TonB
VLKPPTPPERTATTPPSVRKRAIATRTVRPADVRVAKASAREDPAVSTRRSVTEVGTPVLSRPWEAVWGSVRSYTPKQPLATANAPVHQHAAPASPIEDKAGERARARIRGRLETDLSRYFSYPPVARKQGWQGHVSVEFTVQPDGQLTNVRVTRSSGYHVLDQSALAALRKVGHLAEARQWLNGQSITVELPVIYRLEN